MSDLLSCPFCTSEDAHIAWHDLHPVCFVQCITCAVQTGGFTTERDAISAWNTRAQASAPEGADNGNLVSDPLYLVLDALYERGWTDGEKHKHDPRGTIQWQAVLDLFRSIALSDNNDLMCCNGINCDCRGFTKGQYRAYLANQSLEKPMAWK
jgi:Lar family restriction alleviation protein